VTEERGWIFTPSWSPDSKRLAFADHRQRLRVVEVESGALADVDRGARGDLTSFAWSPDSRWLAYEKELGRLTGVWAWSVEEKRPVALSDGKTNDHDPAFSADGRHLFFLSERDYRLTFSAFEFNFVYTRATRVLAAALDPAAPALFPPKNDEEKPAAKAEEKKPDEKKPDEKKDEKKEEKKDEKPATVIVPAGFPARVVGLPGLKAGGYGGLSAAAGAVFYVKSGEDDGESALWRYDLAERKEEKVLDGVSDYALTADGKKLLCRAGSDWLMVDAKANQKKDTKIDLGGLRVKLEPRAEWRQMFDDGWRIVRDWFYDEKLHGVDWAAERERYGALLPHVAHRSDLDFVLGEMISELEAGHTYVAQGDDPQVERVRGGMLGCELEADAASKRYRIAKVYEGENWDDAWRSPLTEPGVDVRAGHFLLAIDGEELTAKDNPYRLLEGKADRTVALLVAEKPEAAGARTVLVRPIGSESNLRYLDWIRGRLALCDKLSGGKVGYLHLPDTAVSGNRALQKHFYSQVDRPALVIDDRYNGGGFIPDRMIEYFGRRTLAWWARRGVESMTTPGFAHDGPKAMLINGYSSSGGDALPYFFKKLGLGTLVGTRTWGGLIGLSGQPSLVDGGAVQVPTFRIYDAEGKWVVENEGVAPDVEVVDVPEARIAGGDPSLEKAVELLLSELERRPPTRPTRPVPPVMVR
jgi:tricorn protease